MMSSLEVIAKRVFTYLLRRCFGQYLETFTHEELSVDYNKGKAVVEKVALKVEALNSLIDEYNLPFELLHGIIDVVTIEVPWKAPFTENSVIEFRGVNLVVHPKKCADDVSMFASMFESMTSSLQMAEECLKMDNEAELDTATESVETIVRAIDAVFSKLKLKFINTVIRVESILEDEVTGVALEIKIKSASCFDEAGLDSTNKNTSSEKNAYQPSAYSVKQCILEGISLYTAQFPSSLRDISQSYSNSAMQSPGSPEMPPQHTGLLSSKEEKVVQMEPILISRIPGQQQLRLKLKQNESIVGPKVDIEISLGTLNFFMSPYQLFLLIELANGLTKPGTTNKSSNTGFQAASNRPMRDSDYALVEQELQKLSMPIKPTQHQHGWSSNAFDETDEEFHLMKVENKSTEIPLHNDDLESSCGSERMFTVYSSCINDENSSRRSSKARGSSLQSLLSDPLIESTQIHLSCSALSVILLHDHRLIGNPSSTSQNFNTTSTDFNSLGVMAESFFNQLSILSLEEGLNFKDFAALRSKLSKLTNSNHIRIMASGIMLDINEKTSSLQRVLVTMLTLLDLEILECLFNNLPSDPIYIELVSFKSNYNNQDSSREPCLRLKYEQCDYGPQNTLPQLLPNKLTCQLIPVVLDVDISIVNRIHSLLNPNQCFFSKIKKQENFSYCWRTEGDLNSCSPPKTEVKILSPFVTVNLRFPVPDLQPFILRAPWWKLNLRQEALVMELKDATISFIIDSEQTDEKYEITCRDFHGLLKIKPEEKAVSFIRVSANPDAPEDGAFDWPKLVICKNPQSTALYRDTEHFREQEDNNFASLHQEPEVTSLINNMKKAPSPFSNNSVVYGSKFNSFPNENNKNILHEVKLLNI